MIFFFTLHVFFVFYLEFILHSQRAESVHRRRLEDLQRGLVNYLVGNETTIGPSERLYEYLEGPR